jgi:hypothetical protein
MTSQAGRAPDSMPAVIAVIRVNSPVTGTSAGGLISSVKRAVSASCPPRQARAIAATSTGTGERPAGVRASKSITMNVVSSSSRSSAPAGVARWAGPGGDVTGFLHL